MTVAQNQTPDTMVDNERADSLSNLEDITNMLINEWCRTDQIPVMPIEFYADLADFTDRWFASVVDR